MFSLSDHYSLEFLHTGFCVTGAKVAGSRLGKNRGNSA